MAISKELKNLITDDYQNRKGEYPKGDIPDSIDVSEVESDILICIAFKNTDEQSANKWYTSSKEIAIINKFKNRFDISTLVIQDGDYPNDWVQLQIKLIKKIPKITKATSSAIPKTKVDDKKNVGYEYTYVLSSPTQIEAINLLDYKDKLQKIMKDYFVDNLIKVVIDKSSYTITLSSIFTVGEKRRLGRLISQKTDLKKYVRKIVYNGTQDSSGQLFILRKDSKKENQNETAK